MLYSKEVLIFVSLNEHKMQGKSPVESLGNMQERKSVNTEKKNWTWSSNEAQVEY